MNTCTGQFNTHNEHYKADSYNELLNIIDCFETNTKCFYNQIQNNFKIVYLNNKYIYLWQDVKGNICYSYDLFDKEYYTTTPNKLTTLLSSYFGYNIEVLNNINETYKKVNNAITAVNKSIDNKEFADYKNNYKNIDSNNYQNYTNDFFSDTNSNNSQTVKTEQEFTNYQNQLHNESISLSMYQLNYYNNVYYIYINDIPLVHKEDFMPEIRFSFFMKNDLVYKNSYIPSNYINNYIPSNYINNNNILFFIYYLTKKDIDKTMKVILWIANIFILGIKTPALVLYSDEELYMKLFYEEIVEPLLNIDHCEKIENDDLNKKVLSNKLDKKIVYNFHNITTPKILDMETKDFTNRLYNKYDYKINNKTLSTKANILITSTTSYIPMIGENVPYYFIHIESNFKEFCIQKYINYDYYSIANAIKDDLNNFANLLSYLNIKELNNNYCNVKYSKLDYIIDGDSDILKAFEQAIKNKDMVFFNNLKTQKTNIYEQLKKDFNKDRVNRKNLLEYFSGIFGKDRYTSNKALISDLRELSDTSEPFNNSTTFNNNGNVYYKLFNNKILA
jgi:hypothetical protein